MTPGERHAALAKAFGDFWQTLNLRDDVFNDYNRRSQAGQLLGESDYENVVEAFRLAAKARDELLRLTAFHGERVSVRRSGSRWLFEVLAGMGIPGMPESEPDDSLELLKEFAEAAGERPAPAADGAWERLYQEMRARIAADSEKSPAELADEIWPRRRDPQLAEPTESEKPAQEFSPTFDYDPAAGLDWRITPAQDRLFRRAEFLARRAAARPLEERKADPDGPFVTRHMEGFATLHPDDDDSDYPFEQERAVYREQLRKRGRPAFGPPSDAERLAETRDRVTMLERELAAVTEQRDMLAETSALPDPLPAVFGTWHAVVLPGKDGLADCYIAGRIDDQAVSFRLSAVSGLGEKVRAKEAVLALVAALLNVATAPDPEDYEHYRQQAIRLLDRP